MKAIICDTCGKSVPDTEEADIHPLRILYSKNPIKQIDRDICPACLQKLVGFFEPAVAEVTTLEPVEIVTNSNVIVPESSVIVPESSVIVPESSVIVPAPVIKQAPPQMTNSEKQTIICAHCNKPFIPKNKIAKCCSHYCANHKWLEDQKLKKQNEPKKEKPLKSLKAKTSPQAKEPNPQTKTMPSKKDQPKESSHINHTQDIIGEILNPEIDKKRKKAIAQSPQIRPGELIEVPGMPRTWVQFKPGADPHSLENFEERVGKANLAGVQSSKKSSEPIFDEI